jgi:ribonuclease Z
MIEIVFLGTSGSKPTKHRGLPSIALIFDGDIYLLDCGEGTQRQILNSGLNSNKIKCVFISHLHGDHWFGLPGLIWSTGLDMRKEDLVVYAPKRFSEIFSTLDEFLHPYRLYKVIIKEIEEGLIYEDKKIEVYAMKAKHSVESYSFKIKEKDRPPKVLKDKLKELNIPEGPHLRKLKAGYPVKLPDGRIIYPEQVLGEPKKGKIIVYSGDTAPNESLIEFAKDADVLIHEATFSDEEEAMARESKHSTSRDAARIAKKANVKLLILTHVSARYKSPDLLLAQAKEEFENVTIAQDFSRFQI